jgi:tetratricopeptide (TPR) repeat protein
MELSDRVTEKERLFIEAAGASMVELDMEKAAGLYDALVEKFPREKAAHFYRGVMFYLQGSVDAAIDAQERALELDPRYADAVNMIAYSYAEKGEYEKAVEYFERYVALSPGQANPHDSLADAYSQMGRLEESLAEYEEALRIKPDFGSHWKIAYIHAQKEDYAEAVKWIDLSIDVASVPGLRALGHFWKGFYLYWLGNLDGSFDALEQAEAQAKEVGNELMLSRMDAFRAWMYLDRGEFELSREGYKKWNAYIRDYIPPFESVYDAMYYFCLGMLSLKEGRIDSARSHVEGIDDLWDKIQPSERDWVTHYHDLLNAEVLLAEGALEEAVTFAEGMPDLRYPYTLSPAAGIIFNMPVSKDVLARVYAARGNVDKAVAEYERLIVFDPEDESRFLIPPIYHYRLGVLYEQTGAVDKAREQYSRFLQLWMDADPDLPEVKDARSRLASL